MGVIYLDHLAATPLHPRVKEAMINHIETVFGNPSSDNQVGQPAAEALEQARGQVAALINAEPKEVVFNSGGTESVNHAIKGVAIGLTGEGPPHHHLQHRAQIGPEFSPDPPPPGLPRHLSGRG